MLASALLMAACAAQNQPVSAPTSTSLTIAPPTATIAHTPTLPEPTPLAPELAQKTVAVDELKGLKISVAYPWVNEAGASFEALVEEFNRTNEPGIEVVTRRLPGYSVMSEALLDGEITEDLAIARGFDLAGIDDGQRWVNLGDAPLIEGMSVLPEACSTCADYLDLDHQQRYVTLLYQPALLVYNQSWAKELGFDNPPKTFVDLQEQMEAAAAKLLEDNDYDNNGAGGLWLSLSPQSALAWYCAFGGELAGGDQPLQFNRETLEKAFVYLKTLRGEAGSWRAQNPTAYQYFVNRTAITYEGGLEDILLQKAVGEVAGFNDQWVTIPYPTEDGMGSISLETIGISIGSIKESSQAASAYFVRWLINEARLEKLAEATGLWPVGGNPRQIAQEYAEKHPEWISALNPTVRISVAPEANNWGISRLILQDAALRVYSLDKEFFPAILNTLEATLKEAWSAQ